MDIRKTIFHNMTGCSDHDCIITGKKKGMGTNGGCKCMQNLSRSQLNIVDRGIRLVISEFEKEQQNDQ